MSPSAVSLVETVKLTSMNAPPTRVKTELCVKTLPTVLIFRWTPTRAAVPQATQTASARSITQNGCLTTQTPQDFVRWSPVVTVTWTWMSALAPHASTVALALSRLMTHASLLIVTIVSAQTTGQPLQKPNVLTVILEGTLQADSATSAVAKTVVLVRFRVSPVLYSVQTVLLENSSTLLERIAARSAKTALPVNSLTRGQVIARGVPRDNIKDWKEGSRASDAIQDPSQTRWREQAPLIAHSAEQASSRRCLLLHVRYVILAASQTRYTGQPPRHAHSAEQASSRRWLLLHARHVCLDPPQTRCAGQPPRHAHSAEQASTQNSPYRLVSNVKPDRSHQLDPLIAQRVVGHVVGFSLGRCKGKPDLTSRSLAAINNG